MLTMMMRNIAASSSSYCTSRRWRGMPCLHSNSTLVVFANDYFAFVHSQPSKPIKSTRTQLEQPVRNSPKITTVDDAFNVFDRMLQMRPPPSVVRFNQILGQVAKLKHYSAVISLHNQMDVSGIGPNAYTLNILINCCCHLNQMGFSLSVLGKFFKLGLELDVCTFTTLINGFLLENRVAEAATLLHKMMREGNCQPNVVTFNTLVKGFCMRGNNRAAIQLLRKMEEGVCKPGLVVYNTIIDSLCKDRLVVDALNLFSEMMCKGIPQMSLPIHP
ncbi:pentatricopeptide repeat-containing protein [Prunus yedoensis var. nudiflora]|uniref:Pentatricopeptide repeat-containing protein n=1 Tax=Prunus yedoensis var. nudiflora TaxID=2094558 RepID=A0A314U5F8_PRUYE|nr:pentatricopeptide repeat-containing protein [Prunus yedoensis var. nudiflora]